MSTARTRMSTITIYFYIKGVSQFIQAIQHAIFEFPAALGLEQALHQWEAQHPDADTVGVSGLSDKLLPALPQGSYEPRHLPSRHGEVA